MEGWGAFNLKEKLKGLKGKLKEWNKISFDDLDQKHLNLEKEMNYLDKKKGEEQGLVKEERLHRIIIQQSLWEVAMHRESLLRQKARLKWIKEGDSNSKFFNSVVNLKRRKSMLRGVVVDGVWEENPTLVKEKVRKFFLN